MIPKKIHYCWFGHSVKPKLAQKCIASWYKYCPDYEIIEWNEENFDVNMNDYTKMCYEQKKYAFLSDYVRLWAVYQNGGLYFDTDVELLRSPDSLLHDEAFFGFETDGTEGEGAENASANSGLGFGSVAGGLALQTMIQEYTPVLDGQHGVIGCPELNTKALVKLGLERDGSLQRFDWGTVYPKDYFNPYEITTGRLLESGNTVSVHWYMGSCLTRRQKIRSMITKPVHRIFGINFFRDITRSDDGTVKG